MKQSVFIVDDDPLFAQMLHDHIAADGMRKVRVFHSGEECLNHLFEKPNTVILDYHLDSVQKSAANGLAILEKIRKHDRNVHIIVLSSQTRYAVAAETIAKGAEQYVIKDDEAFSKIDAMLQEFGRED
ncbi:MAG: response regulator [Bacteroidota bacterium]